MADPGTEQDPFEWLNEFDLEVPGRGFAEPEAPFVAPEVPDIGPEIPTLEPETPTPEPPVTAEGPPPAATGAGGFDWLSDYDLTETEARLIPQGPRAFEYEPPAIRVDRSALSGLSDEEAAERLSETMPEEPTEWEIETLHPALNTPEYYAKRKVVARLYNKASSNDERVAILREFTEEWMPAVLERATGRVGWKEKGLTGIATAATWLDNVSGRWVRALIRTGWEDREDEIKGGPGLKSPDKWWDSFNKNYTSADGSFADGEETLKQLYKLVRSGGVGPSRVLGLAADTFVGTGGEAGEDRLKQYEHEAKNWIFDPWAERATDVGYGLTGAMAQIMPGGTNWSQHMAARREAKEMGSVGGHEYIGFVGQMLLDPIMLFKFPKIASLGRVKVTKSADEAVRQMFDLDADAARQHFIAKGETGDVLEKRMVEWRNTAENQYGKETLEAANLINQYDIPNYHGAQAPRVLSSLKDPRFTHVVDDILEKAGTELPGTRPVLRTADSAADDAAKAADEALDTSPVARETAEVDAMQNYRAEAAWAEMVREGIRRQEVPTGIDVSYKGVNADTGVDVWSGAIRWEKPIATGKQTAAQAFDKTKMIHWMDNRRTKIMLGLIRRYPYLEPMRRTAESIMWLEKAQPMAKRRPLGDLAVSMQRQLQDRIDAGLARADDPKVIAQMDEIAQMTGQTAKMRWAVTAPEGLARHGVLHQGLFRHAENFEGFRQRRATLSAQEAVEFFNKIARIVPNEDAEIRRIARHFKELGRHDPATAEIIEKMARVDRIDELYAKAADGDYAELPPALRQEMDDLAREGDFLDAWKDAALEAEKEYKAGKSSRKEAWKKVRTNLNVLRFMMRSHLSDVLAREADIRVLKDMAPVQDQIRQLRIWREEFADLIKNRVWTGDKTFEEAFAQLRAFEESQIKGMEKFPVKGASDDIDMVFERDRRIRILPKGTPEDWSHVREALSDGMKRSMGDDAMADTFIAFNDMRARTWAVWNRLPPEMANAWYSITYAQGVPGFSPVREGVKVSEIPALLGIRGSRILFSHSETGDVINMAEAVKQVGQKKTDEAYARIEARDAEFEGIKAEQVLLEKEHAEIMRRTALIGEGKPSELSGKQLRKLGGENLDNASKMQALSERADTLIREQKADLKKVKDVIGRKTRFFDRSEEPFEVVGFSKEEKFTTESMAPPDARLGDVRAPWETGVPGVDFKAFERAVDGKGAWATAKWLLRTTDDEVAKEVLSLIMPVLEEAHGTTTVRVARDGVRAPAAVHNGEAHGMLVRSRRRPEMTIWLRDEARGRGGLDVETLVHELLHAATSYRLDVGRLVKNQGSELSNSVDELEALFKKVAAHRQDEFRKYWQPPDSPWLEGAFGRTEAEATTDFLTTEFGGPAMLNGSELLAWGLTNKKFQESLMKIRIGEESAWTKFVRVVADLLGIKSDEVNALTELLRITEDIVKAPKEGLDRALYKGGEPLYSKPPGRGGRDIDTPEFKRWFGDSKVVDEAGEPLRVYHGTDADVDQFLPGPRGDAFFFAVDPAEANRFALNRGRGLSDEGQLELETFLHRDSGGAFDPITGIVSNPSALKAALLETGDIIYERLESVLNRSLEDVPADELASAFTRELFPEGASLTPVYLRAEKPYNTRSTGMPWPEFDDLGSEWFKSRGFDAVWVNERRVGSAEAIVVFDPTQIKSTSNVGTWGPDDPRILFSRTEEGLAPLAYTQFTAEGKAIIGIFENVKGPQAFTAAMEELGHIFRRDLPAQDLGIAEKWVRGQLGKRAGSVDSKTGRLRWSELAEEAFARAFVKWLKTGEMPEGALKEGQSALRDTFVKAKEWITEIYYVITGRSTPTRVNEAGEVVPTDPTAIVRKGPQIGAYFEGATQRRIGMEGAKLIKITPDLEATFKRLLDPDSLKGDYSPLVRDMEESMAAFRGSDGVTKAMAFMKFQASARDLSEAAGRTMDEADLLIKHLMSQDVDVRARAERDLDVIKRQAAGRHKAVPSIDEIEIPKFNTNKELAEHLKGDLIHKVGLYSDEAGQLVDRHIGTAIEDVYAANKLTKAEEVAEVVPVAEKVIEPATIDEVATEFPEQFVVDIKGSRLEVRIDRKESKRLSTGVPEELNIRLREVGTGKDPRELRTPLSYAELKASYKGINEGGELIGPELLEARKAEAAAAAPAAPKLRAPKLKTGREHSWPGHREYDAQTIVYDSKGNPSVVDVEVLFENTANILDSPGLKGWGYSVTVPAKWGKGGPGGELIESIREFVVMGDTISAGGFRTLKEARSRAFLDLNEGFRHEAGMGYLTGRGDTPPPAVADEAMRGAEALPVRPESINSEDDVVALIDSLLAKKEGMGNAAVRDAVLNQYDEIKRILNQIQDTGNELRSWEKPIAKKWEAEYDKAWTALGKKIGLDEAVEPAMMRAHEAVADDVAEALYKEHGEAAIAEVEVPSYFAGGIPSPAAAVPEAAARPKLTPESIDKMTKAQLIAEIKARPEQLGPVGRGNKPDLAKRLKAAIGPRGARIVEAPKKKGKIDILRENYHGILKNLAARYVEKHPALARTNIRLGDVRAFDTKVAADAVRRFDELWEGPGGREALRNRVYSGRLAAELRATERQAINDLRTASRNLLKIAWPGDSARVDSAMSDLSMTIAGERQAATDARVRFESKLSDARAEIARKTMAPKRGAPDDVLQDAADVAAIRPTMVSEENVMRAEGAKRWLNIQIADREKFIRMEMSRARKDSRKLKRVVDGEEVPTPLGSAVGEAERGLREAPYEGGGATGLKRALDVMKEPIPETGPWGKIKHTLSDVTKDPEIVVKEISEYMDEALKGLPDTEKAIWDAAKQMGYDLRTPGELWEVILNAKKWARSYGDELDLRRQTALESYRNDNMTALFDGLDRNTQGKIERLLKNRKLYGVAPDAPPRIKALAKSLGMVGTEELFIHAGRKGRVNIGETYTAKQIEDALDVAKVLDEMLENQLEKMQQAGIFVTIDHAAAAEIDMVRVELRIAKDPDEKLLLVKKIKDMEKASTRKWTKEEFLSRANIGSYVPHLKTTAARMKTTAMKRGGMPSSQESFFQKRRTLASTIDDLNEQRRVQLATSDLYHWAVNADSPAWMPDGPFAGKDPEQLLTAAHTNRLEEALSVDEWDAAVKWARREGVGSELYDFFETDFNILIERYLKESNRQVADALFLKDSDGMFPVGDEIAKLTAGDAAAFAELRANEFGYSRLSKVDSIQAATGIPLPTELRLYEDVIQQRLLARESPEAIVKWLRVEKNIHVDTAHIASFNMPYKFLPTPVVEYLRWINKPDWAQGKWWMGWLDGFHSVAKSMATISSIAHVGMNATGNHVSIAQKLGPGIFNPANHLDAMNIFMKMDPEDLTKFEKAMGFKHEDAIVTIGPHSKSVKDWKGEFDAWGISEAPLSRAFLEEIGGQVGGRPKGQLAGSMAGAAVAGTVGGMIGGPIGAAALGFLGQYPGALLGEVLSRGYATKAVAEMGGTKLTALPTAVREGWKRVWFEEMTEFRKSIEIGTAKGAKQATRYFGERSVGLTAGATVGSVFGPAGTVAGAIAGLTLPSYMRMMTGLNQAIESQARITLAVGELRAGKTLPEAARSVDDALRNYSNLTPVEKHVFRRMFFFYTWDAGNMRFQTHQLVKSPRQAAVFGHFMNGVFKGQFTPEEIQAMPAHLRWRIIMRTGPGMIWSVNGLPQQAYVEMLGRWAEGKPAGMLTRVRPDALLMFEFFSDKKSVYYGKGWDELTNVRSLKDASPFLKRLAGFPVKKDPDTGEWVPSPGRRPVFNKHGKITGWKDDFRAMHPERYYMMSKLPGWRILMEQLKLQQDTFTSRAIDYGDPTATATPFQRAMAFMVGSKPYSIDFEAQMDYYTWRYLEELQRQIKLQDKTFFVDIKRAVRRIPPNGGELRIPDDRIVEERIVEERLSAERGATEPRTVEPRR